MKVNVSVQQISHGTEYDGSIEGEGIAIRYRLKFGIPIDQLDNYGLPDDPILKMAKAKELFCFTVTRSDTAMAITDELFGFMMNTAGQTVIDFYNSPQTQDYANGDGIVAQAVRDKGNSLLGSFGTSVSIGMSCTVAVPDGVIEELFG